MKWRVGSTNRGNPGRDEVDLDAPSAELLAVVDQTIQPTRASLWLRPSGRQLQPAGTY
jgi:hypothetical protein